ncbi:hypothetical protein MRS45_10005 [Pseudomonas viridiflava]|uniref:hypothetical protein n=1 Tax=Pseudomonas viridiflava TaxID=33069 RepID=UPI0013CEB2BC|nr:hypothetical protein [Pseudomonas viridiflava]MCJ8176434.1 hypothetical protein [Pseudomonas viridiflava]
MNEHEKLKLQGAKESELFSVLKDSILNIQHGVEILFKHLLVTRNEFLLYTEISKLKEAYKSKAKGEITELYEADGVHTVTFKESIDRLRDICGHPIDDQLKKKLLKVESWRNKISHSAAIISDENVPKVLLDHLFELDKLLAPIIGEAYLQGQGRTDLERAYNLTKNTYGELENQTKARSIEALIGALRSVGIKDITAPDVINISDAEKAHEFLLHLQNDGQLKFSCDVVNGHCSGHAIVTQELNNNIITVYTTDNEVSYQFKFAGMVIYVPDIKNNLSPLVFLYSAKTSEIGDDPVIQSNDEENWRVQHGLVLDEDGTELWDRATYEKSYEESESLATPTVPAHKEAVRILTKGLAIFMNVRSLRYPGRQYTFGQEAFSTPAILTTGLREQIKQRAIADQSQSPT